MDGVRIPIGKPAKGGACVIGQAVGHTIACGRDEYSGFTTAGAGADWTYGEEGAQEQKGERHEKV